MGTIRIWSAADVATLTECIKRGDSAQVAAVALGCSRTSCLKKAKTLKLTFAARRGIWIRAESRWEIEPARDALYVARCLAANPCGFGSIPIREAA